MLACVIFDTDVRILAQRKEEAAATGVPERKDFKSMLNAQQRTAQTAPEWMKDG